MLYIKVGQPVAFDVDVSYLAYRLRDEVSPFRLCRADSGEATEVAQLVGVDRAQSSWYCSQVAGRRSESWPKTSKNTRFSSQLDVEMNTRKLKHMFIFCVVAHGFQTFSAVSVPC